MRHRRHPSTPAVAAAVDSALPPGLEEEVGLNGVPALPPCLLLVLPALPLALHAQRKAALSCQRPLLLQRDAAAPASRTATQCACQGSCCPAADASQQRKPLCICSSPLQQPMHSWRQGQHSPVPAADDAMVRKVDVGGVQQVLQQKVGRHR